MHTPEMQPPEPPVTPEERTRYEQAVWALNQLYKGREKRDPETGKAYTDPPFTLEQLDIFENTLRHIIKRLGLKTTFEKTAEEYERRRFWDGIQLPTPIQREPVIPLPLP